MKKSNSCHHEHPDYTNEMKRLNRISGQIEGIKKMIGERKYCIDILAQTSAVASAIRSLEAVILEKHMQSCVRDSFKNKKQAEDKIAEVTTILKKYVK